MLIFPLFVSCGPHKAIPEDSIRIAHTYKDVQWMPEERHIRHGKDTKGIMVQTPDTTLVSRADRKGWWKPGEQATGMAYKWGGFDTPESFLKGLAEGKKAGDVANSYKISGNDSVVSDESVGIDCSGFVSRCWGLKAPVSTRELPSICDPVDWDEMKMGDILLTGGHVILFYHYDGDKIMGYESGPIPIWKVRQCNISIKFLKGEGYKPWRYKNMADVNKMTVVPGSAGS
ncbi:hypothetical protein [Luteolibacter sp. AS25]|uniref:hypothetical protein n=1 Tax=Luteolibacter sp. AS25 TaxID=3135776 RepID=UPI00398AB40D